MFYVQNIDIFLSYIYYNVFQYKHCNVLVYCNNNVILFLMSQQGQDVFSDAQLWSSQQRTSAGIKNYVVIIATYEIYLQMVI